MMKYRAFTLLTVSLFLAILGNGQTIQEGKNHLYAQRHYLAREVFQQILKTNPADLEALYWNGQTILDHQIDSAKRLSEGKAWYAKALQLTNAAPLIMAGAGQIDLLENKVNDARQKFEAALTMTRTKKGENVEILNAIARANIDAKSGDLPYVIDKMNLQADKGEKNPEMYVLLGNAVRKARPGEAGGEAFRNYQKALELNPNFALASYRLARLFDSQKNWELVLQYLSDCIQKDPKFTPAYYELFYYSFYRKDFAVAEQQLQKYIDSKQPEKDIQDDFLYSQLCWARADFTCAITKAEAVLAELNGGTRPRVFRLLADSYFQAGDSLQKKGNSDAAAPFYVQAKKYSDRFFSKTGVEGDEIILYDYQLRADILDKTGGTPEEIVNTFMQSSKVDTLVNLKVDLLRKGADRFKARGDSLSRILEGDIRTEVIRLKANPGQRDFFDAGFAYYQGKAYERADSIFDLYVVKFPEESYGYMMEYNIHRALDSTMEKGAAVPWALKYLEMLETDTVKNKKTIIGVAGYLAAYNANILKDKDKALEYLRRMLSLDPANPAIQQNISVLEKTPAIKPEGAPKPSSN